MNEQEALDQRTARVISAARHLLSVEPTAAAPYIARFAREVVCRQRCLRRRQLIYRDSEKQSSASPLHIPLWISQNRCESLQSTGRMMLSTSARLWTRMSDNMRAT
ncbi:hypothetical protein FA95DRAFT_587613 [Auriscalpium vulgare]|uniref:Uncharacterized protein n=1 Tax=Auriscalpium vulgare TaxID=40419 RepID=A0ACB8REJ7_9AGAM|nr:hypothetical protein FA95DRAFT_587613 [Auriscalpium vulgare]